jgi:2-dehydropantoate 2-reductase
LVARSNFATLQKNGVKLQTHSFGDYHFAPRAVFPSPQAAAAAACDAGHGWDIVVVTTKALPDWSDDSHLIEPVVGPETTIVIIQNGVGVEQPYRERFLRNGIVSAVTVISAEQIEQGVVRQNRWTRISIGPYSDGRPKEDGHSKAELTRRGTEAVESLTRWWTDYGKIRDVEPHDETGLQLVRWHKLTINAAMNPTSVLSGGRRNADMVSDPELRVFLQGIMDEIWQAVPKILGRAFPETVATPERILKSTERNAGGRPSMLVDWEAGRPLELEVILGNPVRIARERGVEMPRLQGLYALLRSMQEMRHKAKNRGKL